MKRKKIILVNFKTGEPILLPVKDSQETHFGKGSPLEGLRISTEEDGARSAERLIKMFSGETNFC